jgi:hypothetical protein
MSFFNAPLVALALVAVLVPELVVDAVRGKTLATEGVTEPPADVVLEAVDDITVELAVD